MQIRFLDVLGSELAVVWDDGHESYYPLEALRRHCPCAHCAGEPDLFGRLSRGPEPVYGDRSFQLSEVVRVGNYGIQPRWTDGHDFGIWTMERLRDVCPCGACRPA